MFVYIIAERVSSHDSLCIVSLKALHICTMIGTNVEICMNSCSQEYQWRHGKMISETVDQLNIDPHVIGM